MGIRPLSPLTLELLQSDPRTFRCRTNGLGERKTVPFLKPCENIPGTAATKTIVAVRPNTKTVRMRTYLPFPSLERAISSNITAGSTKRHSFAQKEITQVDSRADSFFDFGRDLEHRARHIESDTLPQTNILAGGLEADTYRATPTGTTDTESLAQPWLVRSATDCTLYGQRTTAATPSLKISLEHEEFPQHTRTDGVLATNTGAPRCSWPRTCGGDGKVDCNFLFIGK